MENLTKSELERLAILVEEAAEVQQIVMKIIRHGYNSHNPFDEDMIINRVLLQREIGDLLFAIQLMVDNDDILQGGVDRHKEAKANSIKKYLHHNIVN